MQNIGSEKYAELLDDEQFIEWILFPTEELDIYWNRRIASEPGLLDKIESLRFIIGNIQQEKKQLSPNSKARILNNLYKINQKAIRKQRINFYIRVASSVAVVLLIAIGVWMFNIKEEEIIDEVNYQSILAQNDIDEQSESIELILDSKNRVKIDSANVDIVYSGTGEININSEKIEKKSELQLNQLIVPHGKSSSITLSDGSRIWVNSGSRLIYPQVFEGDKREIYVEGEIYIEVEKKEQPFFIKTEKLEVRVLGTTFNVSTYKNDDEHSVVLVSGLVDVKDQENQNVSRILPNQKFTYNSKNASVDIQNVDVDEYISWKFGFLTFKSENLTTVINKLERYYNVNFQYNKTNAKDIRVSGKLNLKDNISEVLKAISITTPMKYEITDKIIKLEF